MTNTTSSLIEAAHKEFERAYSDVCVREGAELWDAEEAGIAAVIWLVQQQQREISQHPSEDVVDRVAQVICNKDHKAWIDINKTTRDYYRNQAKAAIVAMNMGGELDVPQSSAVKPDSHGGLLPTMGHINPASDRGDNPTPPATDTLIEKMKDRLQQEISAQEDEKGDLSLECFRLDMARLAKAALGGVSCEQCRGSIDDHAVDCPSQNTDALTEASAPEDQPAQFRLGYQVGYEAARLDYTGQRREISSSEITEKDRICPLCHERWNPGDISEIFDGISKLIEEHAENIDQADKTTAEIMEFIKPFLRVPKRKSSEVKNDFDADKARKDLKPEAWKLIKEPLIQSLLYDIDLLPEQIRTGRHWFYMLQVLSHMAAAFRKSSYEWKPIETAPKDGNYVLLFQEDHIYEGRYADYDYTHQDIKVKPAQKYTGWLDAYANPAYPTHWMPRPNQPVIEGQ